ncbi:MAG: DUF4235 domain-containing protein [Rothia sp. (in: high G+C Gram-positive bacteria)]|nr:DUF4235 domain-containing protein [Rothia sp. (in: high G+C Gram-positive bacteria)]
MDTLLKLAGTAATAGAVTVANKALGAGWTKVTGHKPPTLAPEDQDPWRDIIIWTLVSALLGTLVKVALGRLQYRLGSKSR